MSFKRSRRERSIDVAEHKSMMKNHQNTPCTLFSFVPKTGIFPKTGVLFLLWCNIFFISLTNNIVAVTKPFRKRPAKCEALLTCSISPKRSISSVIFWAQVGVCNAARGEAESRGAQSRGARTLAQVGWSRSRLPRSRSRTAATSPLFRQRTKAPLTAAIYTIWIVDTLREAN